MVNCAINYLYEKLFALVGKLYDVARKFIEHIANNCEICNLGRTMIELLANGGPIHKSGKGRLRFGTRKAKMLLDCIEVIEQFAFTADAGRQNFKIPDNQRWNIRHVPHFTDKFEQLLNEPYLQFEEDTSLKLGVGAKRC